MKHPSSTKSNFEPVRAGSFLATARGFEPQQQSRDQPQRQKEAEERAWERVSFEFHCSDVMNAQAAHRSRSPYFELLKTIVTFPDTNSYIYAVLRQPRSQSCYANECIMRIIFFENVYVFQGAW